MTPSPTDADLEAKVERYLAAVTDHLQVNDVPPGRVGEHIAELAEHLRATRTDPWEECGQPEAYAHDLITADRRMLRPVGRRAILVGGAVLLTSLGVVLLIAGTDRVALPADRLPLLAIMAVAAGVSSSSRWSAGIRDSLRRDNPSPRRRWRILAWSAGCGAVAASAAWLLAPAAGTVIRWPPVPSWAAGLVLLLAGVPLLVLSSRGPRFPAQTPLRASRWRRRIRITPK